MATTGATPPKDGLLGQIWSICTTLTGEAMAAASAKVKEAGYDPNRGVISLAESFTNLWSARAVLEDAIEKQKLVQLPITVQRELLVNLEAISKSLQGLMSGVDEVVNLTNAIEALNTSIWKYGLHNLSDQVLGYQTKLNQLKNQELQITNLLEQLAIATKTAEQASAFAADVAKHKSNASALLEQIRLAGTSATELLEKIKADTTQTSTLYSSTQQYEKQSGELAASIKTNANELSSLDASIRKFYGEVDEYRRKITQTSDDASKLITGSEAALKKLTEDASEKVDEAVGTSKSLSEKGLEDLTTKVDAKITEVDNSLAKLTSDTKANITSFQADAQSSLTEALEGVRTSTATLVTESQQKVNSLEEQLAKRSEETIEANKTKSEQLIDELAKLKEQIREQIQQATGFRLFGAFQARQNEIARSKNIWAYAIAALVLISAGVTIWIAHEAQSYSAYSFAFWVKLSLTVPLGFAITFCTVQYGRERRLEEEYAFKSSISVSLTPYRDLVLSILEKDGKIDQSKYTDFVIGTVNNVFTSPTERVFESEQKPGLTKKTFKEAAEVIGTAVKAATAK